MAPYSNDGGVCGIPRLLDIPLCKPRHLQPQVYKNLRMGSDSPQWRQNSQSTVKLESVSPMVSNVKTILRYQIHARIDEFLIGGGYPANEALETMDPIPEKWKSCGSCNSSDITSVMTSQGGWRIHQDCNGCKKVTTTAREQEKLFLTREDWYGDAMTAEDLKEHTKFVQRWSKREHKIHPVYESVCILLNKQRWDSKRADLLKKNEMMPGDFFGYNGAFDQIARYKDGSVSYLTAMKIGGTIFLSHANKEKYIVDYNDRGHQSEKKSKADRRNRAGQIQLGDQEVKQYQLVQATVKGERTEPFRLVTVAEIDDFDGGRPGELKDVLNKNSVGARFCSTGLKMILGNIEWLEFTFPGDEKRKLSLKETYESTGKYFKREPVNPIDASFNDLTIVLEEIKSKLTENLQTCKITVGDGIFHVEDSEPASMEGFSPEFRALVRSKLQM